MKQLILFSLDGLTYGAWKHEIESSCDPGAVHRLPGNPSWFAGIASVEGKTACFYDLQACMGLPALASKNRAALIMAGRNNTEGFLIESGGETIEVEEKDGYPMPPYMHCPGIEAAILYREELIPVLSLTEIHRWILRGEIGHPVALTREETLDGHGQSGQLRLFTVSGEHFAIHSDLVDHAGTLGTSIHPLHSSPDHFRGIMFDGERIRAVIDPAACIGHRSNASAQTLLFLKEGGPAVIVHSDEGMAACDSLIPLPPAAASDLFRSAVVMSGAIIPVITPSSLLAPDGNGRQSEEPVHEAALPSLFLERGFEIVEFSAAGMIHGVPASQVKDVIPVGPCRQLPRVNLLVAGIAEHEGTILPVVDPGLFFGRRVRPGSDARMILMDIDGFRLLLLSETVPVRRPLSLENRKRIPLKLPHRFVYGCYIHNNTVRLILDMATIVTHADSAEQEEDWASIIDSLGLSNEPHPAADVSAEEDISTELNESCKENGSYDDPEQAAPKESQPADVQETIKAMDEYVSTPAEEITSVENEAPQPERPSGEEGHKADTDLSGNEMPSDQTPEETPKSFIEAEGEEDIPCTDERENSTWKTSLDFLKEHMQKAHSPVRTILNQAKTFAREKKLPVSIIILLIFLAGISLWGSRDETPDKTIEHVPVKIENAVTVAPPEEPAPEVAESGVHEEKKTLLLELARETGKISMRMVAKPPENTVSYIVEKGDTLWHIAERFTGNPYDYHTIAKESEIQNPNLIFPGQKVLIVVTGAN